MCGVFALFPSFLLFIILINEVTITLILFLLFQLWTATKQIWEWWWWQFHCTSSVPKREKVSLPIINNKGIGMTHILSVVVFYYFSETINKFLWLQMAKIIIDICNYLKVVNFSLVLPLCLKKIFAKMWSWFVLSLRKSFYFSPVVLRSFFFCKKLLTRQCLPQISSAKPQVL